VDPSPNRGGRHVKERNGPEPAMNSPARVDILIVDDNPAKVLALRSALEPLGENLIAVSNGRDALRQLLDRDFSTVILDVHMPGMDGFETAQMIRGRPRSAHTPIIFVSAINLADTDAMRGYALGAVDYIFAPIVPEVLRAKVSVFVQLHRKTEEAKRHAREVEERTRQLEDSQQRLRLAERMAALGTLSTGLGHDMGNLLLPIQARLESIGPGSVDPETRQTLDGIRACVGHLRRLADGLRLLALDPERGHGADASTDFAAWWNEIDPVLRTVLPRGAALACEPTPGLPPIRIARHLLTQIVFNLVQNAADAMRPAGTGRVRVSAAPTAGGRAVLIGVSDDGPGMSEEVRRHCIEPFFTTKLRGISTGLGLSLVNSIIRRAGGELSVQSAPGVGSTFSFELPAAGPAQADAALRSAVVAVADRRLRSLAASLLRSGGWVVRESWTDSDRRASLLLVDGGPEAEEPLGEFLASGRGCAVLAAATPARSDRRVIVVGASPTPLALSRALHEAMDRCNAGPTAEVESAAPETAEVADPAQPVRSS
jgi:signal transduction histidine kinase